jgi:hypothetical protein
MRLAAKCSQLHPVKPLGVFPLLAAYALLTTPGCYDHRIQQDAQTARQQEFVSIGSVKWDLLEAQRAAHEALRSVGIVMSVEGSKIYDISVPKGQEFLAFEVLKTNAFYLNGTLRLTQPTNHPR